MRFTGAFTLLSAIVLVSCRPGTSATSDADATSKVGLDIIARAAGKKYFGTATDASEFDVDAAYAAVLTTKGEFGQLTPLNSMKWDATEPERGVFNFTGGDALVEEAERHGMIVRGHNCVWYNQLPDWVTADNFTAPELVTVIQTHCSTLVRHFKGKICSFHAFAFLIFNFDEFSIDAWDVINEPFNDDGTFRQDVFLDTLNTSYIPIGLHAARSADPNAKLYINEFNIEFTGPKASSMLSLVKSLKEEGVPVDGIGFQSHFILGEVPTSMSTVMEQMTALGVEVAITELDIRMTLPSNDTLLEQQKEDYTTAVSQCNSVRGCVGVTVWDFTDKYSWVPSTFIGQGAACAWDENFNKKPAFDGIISGFF